uniref:Uncharacterized protein n=1 Tax=Pipistrellus kuhlii TaxID=59472 RepID=A0A7J7UTQ5_PIPKU|nr:hypothetical protein mPipKuh1_008680 [Pipistrellus kuhlii]
MWVPGCCAHSRPTQWPGPEHTLSGSGPSLLSAVPGSLSCQTPAQIRVSSFQAEPARPGASGTVQDLPPKTPEEVWMSESACHSFTLKTVPDISTRCLKYLVGYGCGRQPIDDVSISVMLLSIYILPSSLLALTHQPQAPPLAPLFFQGEVTLHLPPRNKNALSCSLTDMLLGNEVAKVLASSPCKQCQAGGKE